MKCVRSIEAAARYPTAYYGQLARARLGLGLDEIAVLSPPQPARRHTQRMLHAADILYATRRIRPRFVVR